MKSTWLLLAGIAVGILGIGTYIANSDHPTEAGDKSASPKPNTYTKSERRGNGPHFVTWNPKREKSAETIREKESVTSEIAEKSLQKKAIGETEDRPQITNAPRPMDDEPTREELALRAERIQARANRELDRLTKLLDLSAEQQDRIFPLLAQSSTAYHPSLAIQVGDAETSNPTKISDENKTDDSTGKATVETSDILLAKEADEGIYDVLTAEQQMALEDEIIDEDLWWTDIVDDLEDELDESAEIAADEDTGYDGNTGLGNLLQQAAEAAASGNQ